MTLSIRALDSAGRGIAETSGSALFVEGALPGERVRAHVEVARSRYRVASMRELLEPSPERIEPRCRHYVECGGCALQHLQQPAREQWGERVLADALLRIGKLEPEEWLQPIRGTPWHYRRRARLRVVNRGAACEVGFLPRRGHHPFAATECPVLVEELEAQLPALPELLTATGAKSHVDEIDLIAAANGVHLLFRSRQQLPTRVRDALGAACRDRALAGWHRSADLPAEPLQRDSPLPEYALAEGIRLAFPVDGFVQGNAGVNSQLVDRVVELLDPTPDTTLLDLFCGVGNFGIPLARRGARVTGIEGDAIAVQCAERNARDNGVDALTGWIRRDLFADPGAVNRLPPTDAWVVDPPRDGARQLLEAAARRALPARICYISCNPATLARDAALLHDRGYRLAAAACIDMFPQTAHLEALALFDRR